MSHNWSFRGRLLTGAVAWSFGLLVLASMGLAHSVERSAGARNVVHDALKHPVTVVCMFAGLVFGVLQIRKALSGLDGIRGRIASLHDGTQSRLTGAFPSEVQPLAADLNALLDQREGDLRRALTTAGNLAHGLKTPLAVLTNEADRARAAGCTDIAGSIDQQVARMQRQVDYHLARARAMSRPVSGARSNVRDSVDGLVRVLVRLHDDRDLAVDVLVDAGLTVGALRSDVDEILGNLLDNACRWTRTLIVVDATISSEGVSIAVSDDGPGLPEEMWNRALQRGVRADESGSTGLGLAIARELTELYGGTLTLGRATIGGLRAVTTLPA